MRSWGKGVASWAFFLLLPFVVFWRFEPFLSRLTLGNDYTLFTFESQLEFVWSWRHGLVPLYMPGFAGGASASTMTLGQPWHPMTWLCALTPGFGTGASERIGTFYRLIELGITLRVVHRASREAGLDRWPALLLAMAVVFNGRMLDSFRYGASLECYCGMLLACAAFASAWRHGWSLGRVAWGATTIYLTLVGGHPQWALFAVTGACLFAAGLLTRPSDEAATGSRLRFLAGVATSGAVGAALAAVYLVPFGGEFMRENSGRVDQTYAFTTGYSDTVRGTFANFSRPLESDVHGAFGGSMWWLLLACSVPVALIWLRRPWAIVLPALGVLLSLLFAVGKATPFHRWVVDHIPLFSSFRVPGRVTLWIPPMFLLIGWVSCADLTRPELRRRFARGPVLAWAAGLSLLVHLAYQLVLATPKASSMSPLHFSGSPAWVDRALVGAFAATAVSVVFVVSTRGRIVRSAWVACFAATLASIGIALPYGTWKEERRPFRSFEAMDAHHAKHLAFWGYAGLGLEPKSVARANAASLSLARPKGALVEHWVTAATDEEAVKIAAANKSSTVLTGQGVAPRSGEGRSPRDRVEMMFAQWNRWRFEVEAPRGGAFVFGQPKLRQWEATVEGRPAALVTADGTFPAIILEPGTHQVEFRFASRAAVLGMAITLVTLLAGVLLRHVFAARPTWAQRALTLALAVSIMAFGALWYHALWREVDIRTFMPEGEVSMAGK